MVASEARYCLPVPRTFFGRKSFVLLTGGLFAFHIKKLGLFFPCGCIYSQEILIKQLGSNEFALYGHSLGAEIIRRAVGVAGRSQGRHSPSSPPASAQRMLCPRCQGKRGAFSKLEKKLVKSDVQDGFAANRAGVTALVTLMWEALAQSPPPARGEPHFRIPLGVRSLCWKGVIKYSNACCNYNRLIHAAICSVVKSAWSVLLFFIIFLKAKMSKGNQWLCGGRRARRVAEIWALSRRPALPRCKWQPLLL